MSTYVDQSKKMFEQMQSQIEHQARNLFVFPFNASQEDETGGDGK